MKQKIKEALKQGHKKLGVSDEVFERVAASVETFITDESQIAGFVASENTLNLLKSYQSMADKVRDLERINPKPNNETTPQGSENGNQPPKLETPSAPVAQPDLAKIVAEAVAAAVKPLSDELAGMKATRAKETTVAALDNFINGWDYAKGFPKEAAEAKRIALKLYSKTGESMTAEELIAEFRGEFDPAVKTKGVTDFTQPFKSEGGASESERNSAFANEIRNALGMNHGD